jgi:hypothetical protein
MVVADRHCVARGMLVFVGKWKGEEGKSEGAWMRGKERGR